MPVEIIQRTVAEFYGLTLAELRSYRHDWRVSRPRQIAAYLCCRLTEHSYPVVGRLFKRDHSTIIHADRIVAERRATDRELDDELRYLMDVIEASR
jgi:chromosomal replication initiator protein